MQNGSGDWWDSSMFFVIFPISSWGILGHIKIGHNGFLSRFIHNIIYNHSIWYKVASCKRLLLPSVRTDTVRNSCSSRQFCRWTEFAVECPTVRHSPLSPLKIPLRLFCLSKLLSPPKIFLLPFSFVFSSSTNPIAAATNHTLKPKGASPFERHASVAYWLIRGCCFVVLLFYLNFLVYILIYSPAPLILMWEFRNFFGGPNRYSFTPLSLYLSFSLSLFLTEHTYSNNKMTSYEMKNRFTRICLFVCLFVTKKVLKEVLVFRCLCRCLCHARLVAFFSVSCDVTLWNNMTFCRNTPSPPSTLNI